MNKLAIVVDRMEKLEDGRLFDEIRAADDAGVHSVWVGESWGWDAFSAMTLIADRTRAIQVGSGIVNVFSRTPGALAQHFGTLDRLSGGRMLIGLGTSGPNVIEQFHGVKYEKPLRRLREYVEIINILMRGDRLEYRGDIFSFDRAFTLQFETVRPHIPSYIAALSPKSIEQTAEIADGWLPIWTPVGDLAPMIGEFRRQVSGFGRGPDSVTVRSPGAITVTKNVERTRQAAAATFAFYVARMGTFYHEHISRLGHGELADSIREAWREGGREAATGRVPGDLQQQLSLVTDSVEEARERIAEQAAAGVDLHTVRVDAESPAELRKAYEALVA